jgi:hypothetical protein
MKVTFHERTPDPRFAFSADDDYGIVVERENAPWPEPEKLALELQEAYDAGAAGFFTFEGYRLIFTRTRADDMEVMEEFTPEKAILQLAAELSEVDNFMCETIAAILRNADKT